jgi:hypothetical protein
MKAYKIDAGTFTQSDVRVVNEIFKNSGGNVNSDPRLADKIKSEISREKINTAWSNTSNKNDE